MLESTTAVKDLHELGRYVAATLASLENLRADQFELSQQWLYRADAPCGVYFRLQGPRALCLSAIWETDQNTILFYDSSGRRMRRTKLLHSLRLAA